MSVEVRGYFLRTVLTNYDSHYGLHETSTQPGSAGGWKLLAVDHRDVFDGRKPVVVDTISTRCDAFITRNGGERFRCCGKMATYPGESARC